MTKKSENQTGGKSEAVETPEAGSSQVVEDIKNVPEADTESGTLDTKSETIEQIEDISSTINDAVRKASQIEAKQREEDEKNGLAFEDDEEENFKITEVKNINNSLVFSLICLGVFCGTLLVLKNRKKEPDTTQEDELNNGTLKSVGVDSSGMTEVL